MGLDAVLIDEPAQHLGRAVRAVAGEPGRIEVETVDRPLDHALGRGHLGLADGGGRLDVHDDPMVDVDEVVGGIGEERLAPMCARPARRRVGGRDELRRDRGRGAERRLARQHGVTWNRRGYDRQDWQASDIPNRCLSAATSCLYGITEAAVLAAGYAPAVGFLHSGKPLSFVYDIGDIFKFETVVPAAFKVAARAAKGRLDLPLESAVRRACRDLFRQTSLLERVIPSIEEVLDAGGLPRPEPPPDAQPVAFEDEDASGDAGHRG